MKMNKELLEKLFEYAFELRNEIKELKKQNTFPGNDNDLTYSLWEQRIKLKTEQGNMINEIADLYLDSFK